MYFFTVIYCKTVKKIMKNPVPSTLCHSYSCKLQNIIADKVNSTFFFFVYNTTRWCRNFNKIGLVSGIFLKLELFIDVK